MVEPGLWTGLIETPREKRARAARSTKTVALDLENLRGLSLVFGGLFPKLRSCETGY